MSAPSEVVRTAAAREGAMLDQALFIVTFIAALRSTLAGIFSATGLTSFDAQ
jgi:hypothetical protein